MADITDLSRLIGENAAAASPAPTSGVPAPGTAAQPREAPANANPPVAKTYVLDTGGSMTAVDSMAANADFTPPRRPDIPATRPSGQPDEGV
jgi:hypothetical protein